MPEAEAVEVPEDLDPAQVVSLVLTYMTAYQLLHRMAMVQRGEAVLVHGAVGRVGTAVEQRCKGCGVSSPTPRGDAEGSLRRRARR